MPVLKRPQPTDEQRRLLGAEVFQTRHSRGWSIERAAKRAGMSHSTWMSVEAGRRAHGTTYTRIERVFGWRSGMIDNFLYTGVLPREALTEQEAVDLIVASSLPAGRRTELVQAVREIFGLQHVTEEDPTTGK